jgi:hypothetical protein
MPARLRDETCRPIHPVQRGPDVSFKMRKVFLIEIEGVACRPLS